MAFFALLLTFYGFFCRIKVYNKGETLLFYKAVCWVGCCGVLLCSGCRRKQPAAPSPDPAPTPTVSDTMRGVWLSYIELDEMLADATPATAEARIEAAMETCRQAGLNTVFFHLRAHGDAYYPSQLWPAADTAKGVMEAGFDPLACAVAEAHQRGLQLHGWLNPYRLGDAPTTEGLSFEKNGTRYLAPHDPVARQTVLDGVREILERYAVDGIHFDDYFYPEEMNTAGEPFEDVPAGTDVTLWRQTQVDTLVSSVYGLCHQYGKVFGVSPTANVERNRTEAYADVTRWMTEAGYIDYVCPQLYTGFRHESRPFSALLEEWTTLPRRSDVALYIGLALYKVGLSHDPYAGTGADEWATDTTVIPRQMELAEAYTDGYVLFRYGNLTD